MSRPLDELWIVGIDLGQVVTAAVSVRVPPSFEIADSDTDSNMDMEVDEDADSDTDMRMEEDEDMDMTMAMEDITFSSSDSGSEDSLQEDKNAEHDLLGLLLQGGTMRNLKIKQKALCQPEFRFRRALERRKTEQVRDKEVSILPRKGVSDEEVVAFLQSQEAVQPVLNTHYNGSFTHRRMAWDVKKAKEAEFDTAISAIMDMFKEAPRDKVLVAIGLGKFGSGGSKMPSSHGTFGAKLVKTVSDILAVKHIHMCPRLLFNTYLSSFFCSILLYSFVPGGSLSWALTNITPLRGVPSIRRWTLPARVAMVLSPASTCDDRTAASATCSSIGTRSRARI